MRIRLRVLMSLAGVTLIASCSGESSNTTPTSNPPPPPASTSLQVASSVTSGPPEDVVTGLDAPWSIVFTRDAALISERDTGDILEIVDGGTRVVGSVRDVAPAGEGGLLGLAARETDLYVYFTGSDGDNRVVKYPLTGAPRSLGLGEPTDVVVGIPGGRTHNGGRIAFGPDGMLYITTGDAQDRPSAQNRSSLAGKILRLHPDGTVPADNPTAGSPMWSFGHRNVQGLAWSDDGTMFSVEYGQNAWDELNIIRPGGNYGWPLFEGAGGPAATAAYTDPVQQWRPDQASPSGMTVAGETIYVANLKGERLRAIPVADPSTAEELYVGEFGRLRDVTVAPDGSLWFITNNTDGRGLPRPGDDRIKRVELG